MLVDLSSHNPNPATIDWAAAKAGGVQAVFGKATQGTTYTNPYYRDYVSACASAGIPFAAYHFANMTTPAAEAAYFRSVAGPNAKVLDIETSSTTAWIDAFLVALNEPSTEEMTYGSASTLPRNVTRGLLWPAAYGPAPGFGECWQTTDAQTVPGIGSPVDASVCTGTQAQFETCFGLVPTPQGGTVPAPTDVVDSWDVPGTGGGYFNLLASGALDGYGPVTDGQIEYVACANDGGRYHFGPVQTPGVFCYPGLPAADREGTRYFVRMIVLSYEGKPVGVGAPGPAGPQGPAGSPANIAPVVARLNAAAKALAGG